MRLFPALCLLACSAAEAEPSIEAVEPTVKAINFTADWCPNCAILSPRLKEALQDFEPADVQLIDLDLSDLRGKGQDRKWERVREAKAFTDAHQVRYLWDWYGGYTGITIFVAGDNGEPLSCIASMIGVEEMRQRAEKSLQAARTLPPGARTPDGLDCPAPKRPQAVKR